MLSKVKRLIQQFRFQAPQMEKSYIEFQTNSGNNLLTFYNILTIPFTILVLLAGIISKISLVIVVFRVIAVIACVASFIFRHRSRRVQKIVQLGTMVQFFYSFMQYREAFAMGDPLLRGFIFGNVLGVIEATLILTYKDMTFRSSTYLIFLGIKLFFTCQELTVNMARLVLVLMTWLAFFAFCMLDNVLYRRIFKIIYEAGDKLKKFQDLLSNDLPSSLVIVNASFEKIIYSNKFFQTTFYESEDYLITKEESNTDVFKKFFIDTNKTHFQEKASRQEEISLLDYINTFGKDIDLTSSQVVSVIATYRSKDEDEFHYEVKLRKVLWERESCYAIVLHDISDKQDVIALRLANEQKDKLISTISHELRTPINGTLGLIEVALKQTGDCMMIGHLENMRSCSKLLLHLINSIIDLGLAKDGRLSLLKTYFNLHKMLEEIKSLFTVNCRQKGIEFTINTEPNLPKTIYTDMYRLMEILINLLQNAIKFTYKGFITLHVSVDENNSNKLNFCIQDTGLGIKENEKTTLFRMFGKIRRNGPKEDFKGVGLGLTIASELVRALNREENEKIKFESELNSGSKFWFRIDATRCPTGRELKTEVENLRRQSVRFFSQEASNTDDGHENLGSLEVREYNVSPELRIRDYIKQVAFRKAEEAQSISLLLEGEGKKDYEDVFLDHRETAKYALIVDDNPFNLMAADFILKQLGYTSKKAFNGKEGLEMLEQSLKTEDRYCLVLTDIQMPFLDGVEMSKAIRHKIKQNEMYDVPIIAITAKKLNQQEIQRYKEVGISYAFEKPLLMEELKSALERMHISYKK